MGCSPSLPFTELASKPLFHAWNIDDQGHCVKSCYLQVTSTDLVLHQKRESPILWPLQSLRRYGFDSELFSFECGRQCSTGAGIYAFKCKKAEVLFNTLQEALQAFSESELGLSSLNGPEANGSATNGEAEEITDNVFEYGIDSQPSTSTGIKKLDISAEVLPTAPESVSTSAHSVIHRTHYKCSKKNLPCLPQCLPLLYGRMYEYESQILPRCCTIGTCINASKQHYMNEKALQSTTCGSCRTCSLNMCVVRPYANSGNATDSEERARQADYGNVLDPIGMPRQCVHCCCDFKPSNPMSSCSADDCPLHFNNCVEQVTNYARLDKHLRKSYSTAMKMKKKQLSNQQPVNFSSYAHLYNNVLTPTKKWPFADRSTKSPSWKSLPHFRTISSFIKLMPKRSASHFYSDAGSAVSIKETNHPHQYWRKNSDEERGKVSKKEAEEMRTFAAEYFPECRREKAEGNSYAAVNCPKVDLLSDSVGSIVLVDNELVRKTLQYGSLSSA